MAGAGLIAIKRRIRSVTNTRKITKAMGLVATSKLRRSREKLHINQRCYSSAVEIMKDIMGSIVEKNIFTHGNKSSKKLYIAFTSETGLCGAFNGNVISKTVELIKADKENSEIMVVGQKGKNYFNRLKYNTVAEYVDVEDIPTSKEAGIITNHALDLYRKGEIGEIHVVYTKFISAVKMEVETEKLLPIPFDSNSGSKNYIELEPSIDEVLENYISLYLKELIYHGMINSKASEHSSRMTAMDGSTKNANDLLDKLNLLYNRIRQSSITQEISEIVGGAEAQR